MSIAWHNLTSEKEVDKILEDSNSKPVLIFKHSTTCGISHGAKNRLDTNWQLNEEIAPYYLDLLTYRSVSNYIAEKLQVNHQSPQVILLKNEEVVYHTSHHDINADKIGTALAESK